MKKLGYFLVCVAMFLVILDVASAENLIVNGGFETGDFTGWDTSLHLTYSSPEWSDPEIVTSPVHSGNYAAYFLTKDQQYYSWWPGSGHYDQAMQTILNVDFNMLKNMVFGVWTKYTGAYPSGDGSHGSVEFVVYGKDGNSISRYAVRHAAQPYFISGDGGMGYLAGIPACITAYQSGSDWTHTVVDIGIQLVDDPHCGIPENKQDQVDRVDIVIYTFSYGLGDGDAEMYVDDISLYVSTIPATIDMDPDTLNLNSQGKWITAYIELPQGFDVNDIDVSTVLLNDAIPAQLVPTEVGDHDGDVVLDRMVKFDRQAVIDNVDVGEVELTVTGQLTNGLSFEGSDAVKVIDKPIKQASEKRTQHLSEGLEKIKHFARTIFNTL